MSKLAARQSWVEVLQGLRQQPSLTTKLSRTAIPHPREAGARPTVTLPAGQVADYSLDLQPPQPPLMVREYEDTYEAFIAGASLTSMAARIATENPKTSACAGGALLGAFLGAALSQKQGSALLGAGLGLIAGAVLHDVLIGDE